MSGPLQILHNARSTQALYNLFRQGNAQSYAKGTDFSASLSDAMPTMHFIGHGCIKVSTIDLEGRESVHLIYSKGDVFPVLALAGWAGNQDILYSSLTKVRLYSLPRDEVVRELKSNLAFANSVLEKLLIQYASISDRVENMSYRQAEQRLSYRLLTLAAKFGRKENAGIYLDKLFTHRLIGSTIGLSRETVSREFDKLRKSGLIETHNHEIVIKDVAGILEATNLPFGLGMIRLANLLGEE